MTKYASAAPRLFVLDTDTLTLFQRKHPMVCLRVDALPAEERVITVITAQEQIEGRLNVIKRVPPVPYEIARAYSALADTAQRSGRLHILNFDEPAIARFEDLRVAKLNVGAMNLANRGDCSGGGRDACYAQCS